MAYLVTNGEDFTVTLHAVNGDSVQIPARAKKVQIADIFAWNPPRSVRMQKISDDVVDPTTPVAGVSHDEANMKPKKSEPTEIDLRPAGEPPKTVDNPASALKEAVPRGKN